MTASWFETRRKRDAPHRKRHRKALFSLVQKIQRQTGSRPLHHDELALAGQRDVGGLQIAPTEGDIGGDAIAGRHLVDDGTVGGDHGDAAGDQRRDADIAASLRGKRPATPRNRRAPRKKQVAS